MPSACTLYATVYRHTRDRPTYARFTVEWIFEHILEKSLSVTSQEKNCLFLIREKKCYVFLLEGKNLLRKENHIPPPPPWY